MPTRLSLAPVAPAPARAPEAPGARRVLVLSTLAFTLMFAAWLMFGVLGIPIQQEFGLTDVQLAWLSAVAILNGSLWRLPAGIIADRLGGRVVFTAMLVATALFALLVSQAGSYGMLLLLAFLVGFAGNSFSAGIAWNSAWYPRERQGFALGVFGAGNVGASVTKFIGPALIAATAGTTFFGVVQGGWRLVPVIYAVLLLVVAVLLWTLTPHRDRTPGRGRTLRQDLVPLRQVRVWRFSLYYVAVFGAYVALAAWLPSMPNGHIVVQPGDRAVLPYELGVVPFTALVFLLGCAMGIGKAAVYKHIPEYFPDEVGSVGGLVGMLGGLGGFFLPPLFAYATGWTGLPSATFFVLFLLTAVCAVWMHRTVVQMLQTRSPELADHFETPRAQEASAR